jgi:hypothetical protein
MFYFIRRAIWGAIGTFAWRKGREWYANRQGRTAGQSSPYAR